MKLAKSSVERDTPVILFPIVGRIPIDISHELKNPSQNRKWRGTEVGGIHHDQSFPDNESRYHVHIWSHFLEELDCDTKKIAERYPLSVKERYWLHIEGIMHGPQFGRGIEHLWSWNGSQTKLLKKSFMHWAT